MKEFIEKTENIVIAVAGNNDLVRASASKKRKPLTWSILRNH